MNCGKNLTADELLKIIKKVRYGLFLLGNQHSKVKENDIVPAISKGGGVVVQ